jgi:sterol desaturase/sphingolipid hydroxylase (fatty acid hydroxylase superfamily)
LFGRFDGYILQTVTEPAPPALRRKLTLGDVTIAVVTGAIFLGALAVRSRLVFAIVVVAAIFVPMERIFALRSQRVFRARWRTDLVHFVVNNLLTTGLLVVVVVTIGASLRAAVPGSLRGAVAGQSLGLQFAEAFLIAELCGYWAHRATHRVPILWRFHRVHHSIEEMDWLAAGRLHPIDQAFSRSCIVLPLVALGFTKSTFGAFLVFLTFQALFIHANVRFRLGPLRWLITTPEFHHWHHSGDPAAYNSNFAGEFPVLDLIFGTLHLPSGNMPDKYGIEESAPNGYLAQLLWPLRRSVASVGATALAASTNPVVGATADLT